MKIRVYPLCQRCLGAQVGGRLEAKPFARWANHGAQTFMMGSMEALTDPRTPVQPAGVARLPLLKALTSIRFFAALHVALYHLVRPFELWGIFTPVLRVGYVGVSFFFFLSGYILTYSHAAEYEAGRGSASRFWLARIARIYPVYLVSLLFAAYVMHAQFSPHRHILAFLADALMLQTWSLRMVNFFHVTAWSLSVEAFFYLVFPFLLLRMRPRSPLWAWTAVGVLWLAAIAVPAFDTWSFPNASWHEDFRPDPPGIMLVFRTKRLPLLALPEFLAGVSLGWLFLRFKPRPSLSIPFALTGLAGIFVALFLSDDLPGVMLHNGLLIPFYALLILGISYPNWLSRLLSASWLVLLGEASFALYLIHFLFNDWVQQTFGAGQTLEACLWKLACIIPLSILLHLAVERPFRRIILRRWSRKSTAQLGALPG